MKNGLNDKAEFLMNGSNPSALVISEFGMNIEDLRNMNRRFMSCIMVYFLGMIWLCGQHKMHIML